MGSAIASDCQIIQIQIFRYPIRHLGVVRRPAPLGAIGKLIRVDDVMESLKLAE